MVGREWHDIGHGTGNRTPNLWDPGAKKYLTEHNEVERFVDALVARRRDRGVPVLVTEDMHVTKRDDVAIAWGAEDGYSWHQNAGGGSGCLIIVDSHASIEWKAHLTRLGRAIAASLGVHWGGLRLKDGFAVTRGLKNDCIVELLFADNPQDAASWRKHWADAVKAADEVLTNRSGIGPKPRPVTTKPAPIARKPRVKVQKRALKRYPAWSGRSIELGWWSRRSFSVRVLAWQRQMRLRGWKVTCDGYFGDESREILVEFQNEKRLEGWKDGRGRKMVVDGILGPQAWEAAFTAQVT